MKWANLPPEVIHEVLQIFKRVCNATSRDATCNQRDCLRCDLDTAECVKCLYVMMADSRLCRASCPSGYATTWASHPTDNSHSPKNAVMGRICSEQSMLALVSGRDVGIIAGAAVAGAICVGVVIGALLYMRRRTKPLPEQQQHRHHHPRHNMPPRLWRDKRPKATEVPVADEERAEFLDQLRNLRGEADNFLEMLSETRNRFRRLGGPDSATDTKAKAYRAVVRDLSRVLTLLNRREEHIVTVPGDWRRLLSWASRVLTRYKRQKAAKEAGDIPSLEPLSTGGGTLYQTRKQAQAERCRLVALGAPCSTLFNSTRSSSGVSYSSRGTDVPQTHCRDTPPASQISSRSASMASLTPIIFEEEDEDAPENPEDILFDESLDSTPPSTKKSEKQDMESEEKADESHTDDDHDKKQDFGTEDNLKKGIFVVDIKENGDIPSVHINSTDVKKSEAFKNSYLEDELKKRGVPMISQDELLRGLKYLKETNNNITKKLNDINDLCSVMGDGYITTPSVIECLKNLKNKEETNHKLDVSIQQLELENQKFAHDIYEKENELKGEPIKVQTITEGQNNITHTKSTKPDSLRHVGINSKKITENIQTDDGTRVTLPGNDVYINVIRKPVITGLLLSGDPFRDDTIDHKQDLKKIRNTKLSRVPPVSCKAEITRHLSTPRCELTTEL